MSTADQSTELPSSETTTYKRLCKAYDDHEYRKGVQLAEQILSKAPNCSEAIAMKGLCVYGEKHAPEALKLIKDGLAANMKSGALWHALGVYHRAEADYKEAHKCFKMAFKLDGDRHSHTIVRDVSAMCIQMRDWETYSDVRQKILSKKPNVRSNWITHATAQHMLGNHDLAAGIIDVMGQVVGWGDNNIENGEVHAYRAELALLCKKPQVAVEILTQNEKEMPDQVVRVTLLARAYAALGNKKKAEEKYTELYSMGLSERDVLYDVAALRGIAVQPIAKGAAAVPVSEPFVALLDQFRAKFPRSDAPRRVALDYCPLEDLERRLREYCAPLISKMVPSLTSVLKTLYSNAERTAIVEKVFLEWEAQLVAGNGSAFGESGLPNGRPNPLWLVWVLQFLSSHYLRLKDNAKAHSYIDRAIEHTPTIEMLHIQRAKILHREGKFTEAAFHADIGRKLDLQDKYVNGKAAKYYLRCGNVEAADKLLSLFHKASDVDEAWLNMFDMQCAWYEIELGNAFMIRGDVLSALQAFKMVEQNLKDNHNELLDYHAYTLRRSNIRSWFDVIKNDDNAHASRFFLRAAPHIVRAYLRVDSEGEAAIRAKHVPRVDVSTLTKETDDKKRLEKLYKDNTLTVDLSKPLEDCQVYLSALQTSAAHLAETHELGVEVALRQNRPLLALKAIRAAKKHVPLTGAAVAERLTAQLNEWRKTHTVPEAVAAVLNAA